MARWYGSLTNRLMENALPSPPKIGDGATELCYSDRHAYTVVGVNPSGKRIILQADRAIRTDTNGQSDAQSYRYEPNPKGALRIAKLRTNGQWRMSPGKGNVVLLGERDEYYDYGF